MCASHQDLDRDFVEVAGDLQPCACAVALCAARGLGRHLWQPCGRDVLERHLRPDTAQAPVPPNISDDVLTVRISVCGEDLLAVGLVDGWWGLVTNCSPTAAGQLRCLLCRKNHCPHTCALDAGEGGAEVRMDRDTFDAALAEHVDPTTGKRHVMSISQLPVPEEGLSGALDDVRAAAILHGRMCGSVPLPREFGPSREACSCGADAWEEYEPRECLVCDLTNVQRATWHKLRCRSAFVQANVLACQCWSVCLLLHAQQHLTHACAQRVHDGARLRRQ